MTNITNYLEERIKELRARKALDTHQQGELAGLQKALEHVIEQEAERETEVVVTAFNDETIFSSEKDDSLLIVGKSMVDEEGGNIVTSVMGSTSEIAMMIANTAVFSDKENEQSALVAILAKSLGIILASSNLSYQFDSDEMEDVTHTLIHGLHWGYSTATNANRSAVAESVVGDEVHQLPDEVIATVAMLSDSPDIQQGLVAKIITTIAEFTGIDKCGLVDASQEIIDAEL